jgi:quercetin dioxygenase-like cupin family protein
MRKAAVFAALAGCTLAVLAADEAATPKVVLPTALTWTSPPNNPALQGAWVLGAEQKPGPYILRVKLAAGGKIAPHTHPDERNSTVLSGTVYVGFGKTFDAAKMVAVPPGGVYVAPANVPHFVWAKDGEVVYQEAGVGPTATNYGGS